MCQNKALDPPLQQQPQELSQARLFAVETATKILKNQFAPVIIEPRSLSNKVGLLIMTGDSGITTQASSLDF